MISIKSKDTARASLPFRSENVRSYILLGALFLMGTVIGVYKPSIAPAAIKQSTDSYVFCVLAGASYAVNLFKVFIIAAAPPLLCTLCAFTTFGAVIILPLFILAGCIAGQAVDAAYSILGSCGVLSFCASHAIIFTAGFAAALLTGAQALSASSCMLNLALGKVPPNLPVFDLSFYRRFLCALLLVLLFSALHIGLFRHIINAVI